MSLAREYTRQYAWRDWAKALDALPPLEGTTVIDLGCAVGDQAAELAARGAIVIGIDGNEELLREARKRRSSQCRFLLGDLPRLEVDVVADGIWCSFVAAYFVDFSSVLGAWRRLLRPGGWIAVTEVDGMFDHEPLGARAKSLLDAFAGDALSARRYDYHMGRKLRPALESSGFAVTRELILSDAELSFSGPARPDVMGGWRDRFARMRRLRDFCGDEFESLRDEFLGCLGRRDHRSSAKVYCCIGVDVSPANE